MRLTLLILFFLTAVLTLPALDINDPADNLYRDLEYWQELGYYRHLPEVRPYSAQLILSLLKKVMLKGRADQAALAESYYDDIDRGLRVEGELELDSGYGREGLAVTTGTANFFLRGMIRDNLSVWGQVSANGLVEQEEISYYMYDPSLPYGERSDSNVVQDISVIGNMALLQASTGMFSLGTEHFYTNIGISRGSFGPYWGDSVVISSEAKVQGHFELTWREDDFSYTMLFLELFGSDYEGEGNYSDKYMALHSYNWAPRRWLDIGFFESVVYGDRLEPLYLMPFSYLFYSQGLTGFDDNSLIGLKLRSFMPGNVEYNGILYIDDLGFNELVKLDFDTKIKIAFETGFSWTPAESWLDRISLDYTAVFPYMYTHGVESAYTESSVYSSMNTSNYSHAGENLGVSLSPNSDRISLSSRWRLTPKTELTLKGNWIRHGNASSENVGGTYPITDGSLWDNGFDSSGNPDFATENEFLTQDVLEKVLQLGFEVQTVLELPWDFRNRGMAWEIGGGYTFERIWNSGRYSANGFAPVEGNNEINHYISVNSKLSY